MTISNPGNPGEGANPFGSMDLDSMLQQAQAMQQQMDKLQGDLVAMTFEGSAGGVGVTVSGSGELTGVTFTDDALAGADAEDLGDLVVAAFRDAHAKSTAKAQELFGPLTQGLGFGG